MLMGRDRADHPVGHHLLQLAWGGIEQECGGDHTVGYIAWVFVARHRWVDVNGEALAAVTT